MGWSSRNKISRNGGETWTRTGIYKLDNHAKKWSEICYQSPTNKNVLFAGNFRSDDYGETWVKLRAVAQFIIIPLAKELYGSYKNNIVVSYDDGATWEVYITVKTPSEYINNPTQTTVWDIAYDGINNIFVLCIREFKCRAFLCKVQNRETTDITGNIVQTDLGKRFQLVAVDPDTPM